MGQKPLKIESGVPVPYIKGNRGMYVDMAKKMKTGDSIFLDNVGAKSLLAAARRQGKNSSILLLALWCSMDGILG